MALPALDGAFCARQPHQPFFCEENVWRLLQNPELPEPGAALFLTNPQRSVAVYSQRLADQDPVLWDYHVLLLLPKAGLVLDLDDREPMARPLSAWLSRAFRADDPVAWQPCFRMVQQDRFLRLFSSDRSHMLAADGSPLQPLPPWPAPYQATLGMTLPRFLAMDDDYAGPMHDTAGLLRQLQQLRVDLAQA